jgi:hypothetical protein
VGDKEVGAAEHGQLIDVRVRGDARGQRAQRPRGDPPDREDHAAPRARKGTRGISKEGGSVLEDGAERDIYELLLVGQGGERRLLAAGGSAGRAKRPDEPHVLA